MSAFCAGCNAPLPPSKNHGRPRKWCSERCRKGSYGQSCIDCGARTAFGAEKARVPEPRCYPCWNKQRKVWTPAALVAAIRAWAGEYGEPPAQPDWNPHHARCILHDEQRARRFEDAAGRWPSFHTVVDAFGSWNAGIAAAGFTPRTPHGCHENAQRLRSVRERQAA